MSALQVGPYSDVARKWLALAERRRAHLIELCESGRWKHYYTQAELLDHIRDMTRVRDAWASLADNSPPQAEPPATDPTFAAPSSHEALLELQNS
jgi:uncharacterized repeat protein (TIGR03809 family)